MLNIEQGISNYEGSARYASFDIGHSIFCGSLFNFFAYRREVSLWILTGDELRPLPCIPLNVSPRLQPLTRGAPSLVVASHAAWATHGVLPEFGLGL
jgi:hypothetical protein